MFLETLERFWYGLWGRSPKYGKRQHGYVELRIDILRLLNEKGKLSIETMGRELRATRRELKAQVDYCLGRGYIQTCDPGVGGEWMQYGLLDTGRNALDSINRRH